MFLQEGQFGDPSGFICNFSHELWFTYVWTENKLLIEMLAVCEMLQSKFSGQLSFFSSEIAILQLAETRTYWLNFKFSGACIFCPGRSVLQLLHIIFHELTFCNQWSFAYMQHEAGHFLIAYLLGVLPRGYTLSSLEAFVKEGSLNVQAGTSFVDFEFVEEVSFSCPTFSYRPFSRSYILLLQLSSGIKKFFPRLSLLIGPPFVSNVLILFA